MPLRIRVGTIVYCSIVGQWNPSTAVEIEALGNRDERAHEGRGFG